MHHLERLEKYFRASNVVYLSYWNSYDKVICFNTPGVENCEGTDWSVTVQACDEHGNVNENAPIRVHCTDPVLSPRDKVVSVRQLVCSLLIVLCILSSCEPPKHACHQDRYNRHAHAPGRSANHKHDLSRYY